MTARKWTWIGGFVAALAALLVLPALAGAANPANSFVIGWQNYTKTGQGDQARFMTWRISSSGSLSSTPVYTGTSGFVPMDVGSYRSSSSMDRVSSPRMQVTPDGRYLLVLGYEGNYIRLRSHLITSAGNVNYAGAASVDLFPTSFTIAPNGKWVYVAGSTGLKKHDLVSGGLSNGALQPTPTNRPQGTVLHMAVSPNSRYLVWAGSSDYGVYSIGEDGSLTPLANTVGGVSFAGVPSFSPNGSMVAFTGGNGYPLQRVRTFDSATGAFTGTMTLSQNYPTGYWSGDNAFWSTDSRHVYFGGIGGGYYGMGCIYSCDYGVAASVNGNTLTATRTQVFDNDSNNSATALGKLYTARSTAMSPDGDTIYRLSVRRSSYRSYTHSIEAFSFRNGVLGSGGTITACSDNYDPGNSQTPGRGDNCGGPYEITSTRPSLNITEMGSTTTFTNQSSWTYTVRFNQAVTGLAKADFSLEGTASGFAVSGVTGSGEGPYTVTVSKSVAAPREGTVILRLATNSVNDAAGTTGPAASFADTLVASAVTYDVTPPNVTITAPDSPLNTTTPAYALAFSEPVQAVDLATGDFTTTGTTTTTFSVTSVTPNTGNVTSGSVTLTGTSSAANGDLVLNMSANTVRDRAGNTGPAATRSATASVSFAPNNTAVPTVAGTLGTGETLSVGGNTWTGLLPITFAYQWQSSLDGATGWTDISGATAATYKIPTTGGGLHYRVSLTASNARGTSDPVISAGRGPATISPVMLMAHAYSNKIATLTIRADGTLDSTTAPEIGDVGGARYVVITPDRRFVYVVALQSSRIYGFKTDAGGGLSPNTVATISGTDYVWVGTNYPTGVTLSTPVSATISGDGRYLYVLNRGNNTISQFSIGRNGTLAPLSPATVGAQGEGTWIGTDPAGAYVYTVSNRSLTQNNDWRQGRLREYRIESNGQLTSLRGEQAITGDAQMLAFTPNGKFAYTVSYRAGTYCSSWWFCGERDHSGRWQRFNVSQSGTTQGQLSEAQTQDYNHLYWAQVSPDGQTIWMLKKSDGTLLRYRINQTTGELSDLTSYDAGDYAHRMALSPNGQNLYVTSERSGNKVFQYSLSSTGVPTPLSPDSFTTSGGEAGFFGFGPSFTPLFGVMKFESTNATLTSGELRAPGGSVDYTLTFTRPVTGLTADDFIIGGTAQNMAIGPISGSGAGPYTFTVSAPGDVNGTVTLELKPNSVTDLLGASGPSTSDLWTTLRSAPVVRVAYAPPTVSTFTLSSALSANTGGSSTPDVRALAATGQSFCAIVGESPGNAVKCWGINTAGVLGDGTTEMRTAPVTVVNLTDVVAIDGDYFGATFCAVIANGTVKCWGSGVLQENGTFGSSSTPQTVPGLAGATAVSVTGQGGCAIVANGAVRCWGANQWGQLGNGTTTTATTPVNVTGLTGVTAISAGGNTSCAIVGSTGALLCWGVLLGQPMTSSTFYRTPVTMFSSGVTAIEVWGSVACARFGTGASGSVRCWGSDAYGILGSGRTGTFLASAANTVQGVTGAMPGPGGTLASCFVEPTGILKCAGQNGSGQFFLGTTGSQAYISTPVTATQTGGTVTQFVAAANTACVLLTTQEVRCSGYNAHGQRGVAPSHPAPAMPNAVTGLDTCSTQGAYKIDFSITFGASVTGLTCTDIANSGTSSGWTTTIVSGSGTGPYTVRMSSNTLNPGTVIPTLAVDSVRGSVSPGPAAAQSGPTQTLAVPAARSVPAVTAPNPVVTGSTLTVTPPTFGASAPTWAGGPTPTLTYQWQVSSDDGATWTNATGTGATSAAYTVASGDANKPHRAVVTATNLLGTATEFSQQVTATGAQTPGLVLFSRTGASTDISGTSATFRAVFSHVPQGLAAADFRTTGTASGWSVQSITGSGIGPYTITVGGSATGEGTLGLQLRADSTTVGYASYPSGTAVDSSDAYSVTRVPPDVAFFAQTSSGSTSPATYNLTFTGAIEPTSLTTSDFSAGAGWTVTGVTGSGSGPYTVTLTGSGAPAVTLAANSVANAVGTQGPAAAAPAVSALSASFTPPSSPTPLASLAYTLRFSEAVSGIEAGDFSVTGTGASGCVATPSASTGTSVTVTLTSCAEGTVLLSLASGSVTATGGAGPAAAVAAPVVTRDATGPTASSFTATSPANTGTVIYALTFNEAVRGLTTTDFTVAGTPVFDAVTTPGGWRITSVTGSGAGPYTVVANATGPTDGTSVTPTLAIGSVTDLAGNTGPAAAAAGTAVAYDATAPTVSGLTAAADVRTAPIAYTLTVGESIAASQVTAADFTIGGTSSGWSVGSITPASGSASSFTISLQAANPTDGTVILRLRQNALADPAGNLGPAATHTGATVTFDATAPTVQSFTAATATVSASATSTFTLTFSEAVSGIVAGDFENAGTATGCTFAPGAASGTTITVSVSNCTSPAAGQTIIPRFKPGQAVDAAGNTGPATAATVPSGTAFDLTAPTVSSNVRTTPASGATNVGTMTFTVTFSEEVAGFTADDITINLNGTTVTDWTVTSVTGNEASTTFTVTVTRGAGATSGDGAITIAFDPANLTDAAGNAGAAGTSASTTSGTYDTTAPTSTATISAGPTAGGVDADSTPTFAFGGGAAGETHECKIDSGSFAACTSPYTVAPALADGSHTLTVRTVDAAGNASTSATTVTRTWTTDTTPPDAPTIGNADTEAPYPQTNQTSRSVSFVPAGAVEVTSGVPFASTTLTTASIGYQAPAESTVRCKVDGGAWTSPCAANPLALTGLAVGAHTVLFDTGAGTLQTKVTWSVVGSGGVDTRNPVGYYQSDGTTVATQCKVDAGAYADCGSPVTFTGLATGDHTATISALDPAGNRSTATTSWTTDTTPPAQTPTFSGGPPAGDAVSDATPTFSFPSASGLSTECRIDGGSWQACTSPYTIAPAAAVVVVSGQPGSRTLDTDASITVDTASATLRCTVDGGTRDDTCDNPLILTNLTAGSHTVTWDTGSGTVATTVTWTVVTDLPISGIPTAPTYSPDVALADGSHTFDLRYVDPAGNGGTAASRTWSVDTTAPAAPGIASGPAAAGQSGESQPVFGLTGAGAGDTYQCKVDTGPWEECATPYTAPTLGDGSHTLQFRLVDDAGNASTATTRTWNVDTTAPTSTAAGVSPTSPSNATSASIALSGAAAGETYQCSLDGGAWATCTSPFTASGLTDGQHTLRVRTVDGAGNTGPIGSVSWAVDTTAPTTPPAPNLSLPPSGGTNQTSVSGSLPTPTPGSTLECKLDGGAWGPCPSPLQYTGLSAGSHTLQTREIDATGNTGPVTETTWLVDTTPPAAPTSGSGPSTTVDQTPTVTFTGEPGATFECRIDGGSWVSCASPYTPPSNLPNGSHTLETRQIDGGGNVSSTTSSYPFTVNTTSTAAEVGVTGTPTSPTNQTTASLTPTVVAGTGTIRCTVDATLNDPCSLTGGALALTGLVAGDHVVVFDTGAGSAATTVRWTIDQTAPAAPRIGQQPANPTNATTATFTFSGEPNVTFECSLDGGAYQPCTSPHTTGTLAAGSHTFAVQAKDAAGNLSATADSVTWTIDTTAPSGTATLTQKPNATTTSQSATFAFTLGADGASAQCSTNGTTWAACTSPVSYSGLAEGSHAFHVRVLDAAGNVSTATPTSYTWAIDLGPPTGTPTFSSQPAASSSSTRGTFAFSGATAPETYECRVDSGSWVACTSPYTTPALTDGPHTFTVRIVDPAGNVGTSTGSVTWAVDTTAPSTPTVSGGSTGTVAATTGTLEFAAPPSGTTAECRIDEGAWAACTSPKSFTGLADGAHTAEVRFVDAAGNVSAAGSRSWISDTTPPAVAPTIPTQVPASTSATSMTIGVNPILDRGESVECRLDGAAWTSCSPPVTYTGLADGSHTFETRTVDAAGNATDPAGVTWTVDSTPPAAPTIGSGVTSGGTAGPTPTIAIPTQPGDVVECRIDSTAGSPLAFGPCPVPYTVAPALAAGAHTIEFRIVDAAGNEGAATSVSFTVDDTPPPAPTIASGPSGTVASVAATFTFTSSEAGATFVCSLDGGAFAACSSPQTYANVGADGSHTFSVKAVDVHGNQGTATTRTWSVDTTGPQTAPTVDGVPASPSTSNAATLTITATESGATFECSVNGAAYAACTSPYALTGLSDGTQTVLIRQLDVLGNPGVARTVTWTTDTIGPNAVPTASGAPSGITAATGYTISFSGAASGETYQCSTDGGSTWATCTSPQAASDLADGTQRFAVRLLDAAGNAGPAAQYLWVIETGPPTTPPTSGATPSVTGSSTPSFTFTGGTTTTFECRLDGGVWAACTSPFTPPSGLPAGAHSFEVRQVNGTGNGPSSTTPFVVDPAAPAEVIVTGVPSSPTTDTSANLALTVESGATLWCKIDDGAMAACSQAVAPSPLPAAGQPVTYLLPLTGLAEGTHTVSVYQVDASGVRSATTTVVWRVDTSAPVTPAVGTQPPRYTSATSTQIAFTTEPGTTSQCSVDGGAWVNCTSPQSLTGLADGNHTFEVRSADGAGNIGAPAAPVEFTVDRTPPATAPTITGGPATASSAAVETFNFTLPGGPLDGASAECSYDDGPWTACASPHTISSIGLGPHTLRVRPVDAAGNVGSAFDTHSWTRVAPSSPPAGTTGIQIEAGATYARGTSVTIDIVWPTGAYYIELANAASFAGSTTEVVSTRTAWTLAAGVSPATVYARFTDSNGTAVGAAQYTDTIIVDDQAPTVSALTFERIAGGVTVTPTATDAGSGMANWQATTRTSAPGAAIPASTASTAVTMRTPTTVYVRATDVAGNVSGWFSAAPPSSLFGAAGVGSASVTVADHLSASTKPEVDDSGRVTVPLACDRVGGTCVVTVSLELDGRRVGGSTTRLPADSARELPIRLSPTAQRELAEQGRLTVTMRLRATTAAGSETRSVRVTLTAPLSASQRVLRGKRATSKRAYVLAACAGAAPLHCAGTVQLVTVKRYTIDGRRARVVLGRGTVKGAAGSPITVGVKLNAKARTLLGRFGFVPVRAVWTLPVKARAKVKKGQKPYLTSRAFRIPTRITRVRALIVRPSMLPRGWRTAGETPDVSVVFRGRTPAQIERIKAGLSRFLQVAYAGPLPGQWLTSEGYVYRDAAAAQRGLEAVLDVAKTRGPIETARSFQYFTLPLPADLQAKGLAVTTTADGVERTFRFWCWRQVNMVFCNRTPAGDADLLPAVTDRQIAVVKRNLLG